MKHVILFGVLLLPLGAVTFAQQKPEVSTPKCTLGLAQSPELRGLRLGMTEAAVVARFPGVSVEKPDKFGLARLRLSMIDSSSMMIKSATRDKPVQPDITAGAADGSAFVIDSARFPTLKGVRRMQIRFIDGRVALLDVAYDDEIKWESIDDFVETVSGTLKLPKEWQTPADSDGGSTEKELRCQAFVISASTAADPTDTHAGPELNLQDSAAWEAMSKRQNDLTEKAKREEDTKRKAFKP
jgi:hypothetical protein